MRTAAKNVRAIGLSITLGLLFMLIPATALGQVELFVRDVEGSSANTREFTVRVTSTRISPTTSVRVDFPPNVRAVSFLGPPTDWGLQELTPDAGGDEVTGMFVRGGLIERGGYTDFQLIAEVGGSSGSWRVEQTYKDSAVDVWQGGATLATDRGLQQPAAQQPGVERPAAAAPAVIEGSSRNGFLFWLGLFLLAASVASLVVAAYVWSTQPRGSGLDEPAV